MGKNNVIPPGSIGDREREELKALIREAHEAAQDVMQAIAKAQENWEAMNKASNQALIEHCDKHVANATQAYDELLDQYYVKSTISLENFHASVFGGSELPPSVYVAMARTCTIAMVDLMQRQADRISTHLRETAKNAMLHGDRNTGREMLLASEIAAIVQGRAMFDAPLLDKAFGEQLFGALPDYTAAEEIRGKIRAALKERAAEFAEDPGAPNNPFTLLVPDDEENT